MNVIAASVLLGLTIGSIGLPAHACRFQQGFDPRLVEHADLVVIGRISDYEIVEDPEARRFCRRRLVRDRDLLGLLRDAVGGRTCYSPDHARFKVAVAQTLRGQETTSLVAARRSTAFGLPDTLAPGPYLMAFGPRDGGYADAHPVLQSPCGPAFILAPGGAEASAVRRLLRSDLPPSSRQ